MLHQRRGVEPHGFVEQVSAIIACAASAHGSCTVVRVPRYSLFGVLGTVFAAWCVCFCFDLWLHLACGTCRLDASLDVARGFGFACLPPTSLFGVLSGVLSIEACVRLVAAGPHGLPGRSSHALTHR